MKTRLFSNWKTSIAGVIAALLMVAGIMWPEAVDPDTQEIIKTATGEIISGVGAIIAVVTNWIAKD